jgi:branched-chain amino acid transport system permease protein
MLQYTVAGLVLGGIYAISASGLVVTYQSAGILNFAFGGQAYFIARFYYYLNSQEHWGILQSAAVSVLVAGPAMGVFLYLVLFRALRLSSPLVKVVATLGLSVTLAPLATLCFGNVTILQAPGLAPQPVAVYRFIGVPVTETQVIVYGCVLFVVIVGAILLRYTDVGLRVRAMVDSPAMTSLSGTSPDAVSLGVWAVSTFLAGLAGVLSAPIIGLNPGEFTLLMAAAFAAVIVARLRNLPTAVVVGLFMGVIAALIERYVPSGNNLAVDLIDSIPFGIIAVYLVYQIVHRGRLSESSGVGGALDRAIAVHTRGSSGASADADRMRVTRVLGQRMAVGSVIVVALLPLVLHGLWLGLLASGVAYAIVFLSFSLVVGEGGMVWLCMVTFAGVGGVAAAQLATVYGWPVLAAAVVGGLIAMPIGIVIGILTIRLGDLYVALVTLTFGLLMDNLVFTQNRFLKNGLGVSINRPGFASGDMVLFYLLLAIFVVVALFLTKLRRSTTGMALTAVRASETAAQTLGVSVLQMKVIMAGLATFVAGLGGALLAVSQGVALPTDYATLGGVVWLAVLVLQGIRSNTAALLAGLSFTLLPGVATAFLPISFGQIPPILFGLGAIGVAHFPDGLLTENARQLGGLVYRLSRRGSLPPPEEQLQPPAELPVVTTVES